MEAKTAHEIGVKYSELFINEKVEHEHTVAIDINSEVAAVDDDFSHTNTAVETVPIGLFNVDSLLQLLEICKREGVAQITLEMRQNHDGNALKLILPEKAYHLLIAQAPQLIRRH
jgi:hypothetical protein